MNANLEKRSIDIRRLVIDEPTPKQIGAFDSLRIISNEKWQLMGQKLAQGDIKGDFKTRKALFQLVCLLPKLDTHLELNFMDFLINDSESGHYMQNREILKRMNPTAYAFLLTDDSPRLLDMKEKLTTTVNLQNIVMLESLASYRRLYPNDTDILEKNRNFVFEGWNFFINKTEGDHLEFAKIAASLRVIYPDRFPEVKFPKFFWQDVKNKMDYIFQKGQDIDFIDFAFNLRILAAKEVKISENGMKLEMAEKQPQIEADVPPLPQTKKY